MTDELAKTARRVADRLLGHNWKVWFWGDSIGIEGLLDASSLLNDLKYQTFVYGLMKAWLARSTPTNQWEYTAPGLGLLRLFQTTKDDALLRKAIAHAEYLAGFPRTHNGAYIRYADVDLDMAPELTAAQLETAAKNGAHFGHTKGGPCVFVDTMHFDAPFFACLFQITGKAKYRELAKETIASQIELLFDEQTSLFHHFWMVETRRSNGVCWGRGQGWAMLGLIHTMECLPDDDPMQTQILGVLRRQCEAMSSLQHESGHWHTVIGDNDSYLETSVAAFVVDGFSRAIRRGWLDPSHQTVVDRALRAILQEVHEDGTLQGVSYETYPSRNAEHYKHMPRGAMVPWGQGPVLTGIYAYGRNLNSW